FRYRLSTPIDHSERMQPSSLRLADARSLFRLKHQKAIIHCRRQEWNCRPAKILPTRLRINWDCQSGVSHGRLLLPIKRFHLNLQTEQNAHPKKKRLIWAEMSVPVGQPTEADLKPNYSGY